MLTDNHLNKYADVLLWGLKKARAKKYKKNDVIMIRFDLPAIKLAELLQAKLLHMGMNPILRSNTTPKMELNFYGISNLKQLVFQPPGSIELCKNLNGSIFLHAPESLTHHKREETGAFGWTLCTLPTPELAKQAKLSNKDYTKHIIKACYLNKVHPTQEWETIFNNALSIKKWLNGMRVKTYHIESENIDLKVTPGERRKWVGISGHNIPSFEIFLSPDWRGTEGIYYSNLPSFRSGNYVKGVRLEFKKGSVIKISANAGEDFVKKQLSMDNGSNKLGEFSLTDKRFSKIDRFMANTLFDENHGGKYGNCHLAVGASYSDTYDGNPADLKKGMKKKLGFNDSALHWDLVNTEKKTVTAHLHSGKNVIIYEDGKFKYD